MGAICGIACFSGLIPLKPTMASLVNSLRHRGPDGVKITFVNNAALAHFKLDLTSKSSTEILPETNCTNLHICADARLDNREELFQRLDVTGYSKFQRAFVSDSELILRTYQKWGDDCPNYLVGDFTFSIWDNDKKEFFCARDQVGIRPYYYFQDKNIFIFSSELRSFLALEFIRPSINKFAIVDYLSFNKEYKSQTIYSNIFKLPPAHYLKVTNSHLTTCQYWQLEEQSTVSLKNDNEYCELLREKIEEAIRCRLQTSFPCGTMLSGGLDSSTLTILSNNYLKQRSIPFTTFSYVLPDDEYRKDRDERDQIAAILAFDPSIANEMILTLNENPFTHLQNTLTILGEPPLDPFYFVQQAIYEAAHKRNIRVFSTGIGGDLAASYDGREFLAKIAKSLRWCKLWQLIQKRSLFTGKSLYSILRNEIVYHLLPTSFFKLYHSIMGGYSPNPADHSALTGTARTTYSLGNRLKPLKKIQQNQRTFNHQTNIKNAVTSGHLSAFMEHRATMAGTFNIEVNHPFLDIRLIKCCMSMPHEQFFKNGLHRSLFRRSVKTILPEAICSRQSKKPFVPDYNERILESQEIIKRYLSGTSPLSIEFIDKNAILSHLEHMVNCFEKHQWHPATIPLIYYGVAMAAFLESSHENKIIA